MDKGGGGGWGIEWCVLIFYVGICLWSNKLHFFRADFLHISVNPPLLLLCFFQSYQMFHGAPHCLLYANVILLPIKTRSFAMWSIHYNICLIHNLLGEIHVDAIFIHLNSDVPMNKDHVSIAIINFPLVLPLARTLFLLDWLETCLLFPCTFASLSYLLANITL